MQTLDLTNIDKYHIANWFSHHPVDFEGGQDEIYNKVRHDFRLVAIGLCQTIPDTPERQFAINKLKEAMWAVNHAIACNWELRDPSKRM
jgi:hypothetical protein